MVEGWLKNLRANWAEADLIELIIQGIRERDVQTTANNLNLKKIPDLLVYLGTLMKPSAQVDKRSTSESITSVRTVDEPPRKLEAVSLYTASTPGAIENITSRSNNLKRRAANVEVECRRKISDASSDSSDSSSSESSTSENESENSPNDQVVLHEHDDDLEARNRCPEQRGQFTIATAKMNELETDLICLAWRDKKVHTFIGTCGTSLEGTPAKKKRTDATGETTIKEVPRTQLVQEYFDGAPAIDIHNHIRQSGLALEDVWNTQRWEHRMFSSIFGIIETNAFLSYKYFKGDQSIKHSDFTEALALQLINNPRRPQRENVGGEKENAVRPQNQNEAVPRPLPESNNSFADATMLHNINESLDFSTALKANNITSTPNPLPTPSSKNTNNTTTPKPQSPHIPTNLQPKIPPN
ncbi:unnamed protein product [Phaedon cochleariae]|uniref:PiggyBac transposable element-derived protein domain-containing protein n=1 Tax=Phaedon cochleariae TaxID=80249 RepID=A0A9N9SGE5_PHACE|nr:unnamed protein product [Phaedon cochleariae]